MKMALSFCIPTYNRAQRVLDCVTHILRYPGNDIEVVISDNASEDNTLELLGAITDSRLKIYSNEKNIYALNWPLAVSRASGRWAVLMSDEDIVNLDAISYYIDNLLRPEIGMIIYAFPPIVNAIDFTYICESRNESLYNAIKFCGHITGAVHNTSRLKIECQEYYKDFLYPPSNDVKCEPQLQMCMDNATTNMVMLTEVPLCFYGRVQTKTYEGIKHVSLSLGRNYHGGNAPYYRAMGIKAFGRHITENITNPPLAVYYASLRRTMLLTAIFYGNLLTHSGDGPDIALWNAARKEYGDYDRNASVKELCHYFNEAVQYLSGITQNEHWHGLSEPFERCFRQEYGEAPPSGMTTTERVMFGDMIFSAMLQFYRNFGNHSNTPEAYFAEDFGDSLGMKSREIMRRMIRCKDYDGVIALNAPDNVRTMYYRGEAYFGKDDLEKAEECFGYVVRKTIKPEALDDIIINEIAVQYSLYYMGVILWRKKEYERSERYFADCYRLSDELLIRANLSSPGLPKREH